MYPKDFGILRYTKIMSIGLMDPILAPVSSWKSLYSMCINAQYILRYVYREFSFEIL